MEQSKQIVLITGGSSGIGLAIAQKFLANDNTVIITGRNFAKLEKVKQKIPKYISIKVMLRLMPK